MKKRDDSSFVIMQFGLTMQSIRKVIGGFYFKERLGERIATLAWHKIRTFLLGTQEQDYRLYFNAVKVQQGRRRGSTLEET